MCVPICVGCVQPTAWAEKAGFAGPCSSVPEAMLVNASGKGDSEPEIFKNLFPWLFLYLNLFCVFRIGRCAGLNFRYSFFAFR